MIAKSYASVFFENIADFTKLLYKISQPTPAGNLSENLCVGGFDSDPGSSIMKEATVLVSSTPTASTKSCRPERLFIDSQIEDLTA